MSWQLRALCFVLLLVTAFLSLRALEVLPLSRRPLVAAKYAGWSGVLRLWVCVEWSAGSGSLIPWVNACAAAFEKAHPGVYVQAEAVEARALRDLASSGVNPPDMLLFSPGLLAAGDDLLPLYVEATLKAPLAAAGVWDGAPRAVPVAMGVYAWAHNTALLPELPDSWADAGVAPGLPPDDDGHCWSAAVLALCSGLHAEAHADAPRELPGLDLGLDLPDASPVPAPTATPGDLPCALPADAVRADDVDRRFVAGELAAMPVTQRELRRLELLADSGRGPDWSAELPGTWALADQLALFAAVDWPRRHRQERAELSQSFLDLLLSDECQAALARVRAFPVAAAVTAYADRGVLARLENALKEKKLLVPSAFDPDWRADAGRLLDRFIAGEITARAALTQGLRWAY